MKPFSFLGRERRVLQKSICLMSLMAGNVFGFVEPSAAREETGSLDICDLNDPSDVANLGDAGGQLVVVADSANNRVLVLGTGCSSFPFSDEGSAPDMDSPMGVAVDPEGRIYVADTGNDRIMQFDSVAGLNTTDPVNLLDTFSAGLSLNSPEGLGASDLGLIYIANTGAQRLQIMDSIGVGQGTLGTPDNADDDIEAGEFLTPSDVAVCPSTAPGGLAGRIFVTDRGHDTVHVFADDGSTLFRFGGNGSAPGMFQSPRGISVDAVCNVYVADTGNQRVQMFDGYGGYLETLGVVGQVQGVALAPFGGSTGAVYFSTSSGDDIRSFEYINYDIDGDGNADNDGDGLPDLWEEEGIDLKFDGTVEYDLAALGADIDRKTVFVEVDYLSFHEPRQDALDAVIDVFAQAPVSNPDGSQGIDLIVLIDDDIEETPERADLDTWSEFDDLKSDFFGTAAERALSNSDDVLFAKLLAYRYGLYGHIRDGGGSSGRAKGGGNFLVTLGSSGWGNDPVTGHDVGTFKQQAGTFMHELGHTLSLGHGGLNGKNYKPNYLSVMNYSYQTGWIPNPAFTDGRLDYSSQRLPAFAAGVLDENDLDETQGLGLEGVERPEDLVRWDSASGVTLFGPAGDPIDWDGQNGANNLSTASDLNDDEAQDELAGQNDWDFLAQNPRAFNFRDSIGFAQFGLPLEDEEPELTDVEAREISDFWRTAGQYRYVYSAKFLCVPLVGPEGTALSPGRYQTAINVHNPSTQDVRFKKKAVIARNELDEKRGEITPLEDDVLADDEAISIDCTSIAKRFGQAQPVGDGFVVIKSNEPLDVVAVYTSRDSVDVERIVPVEFGEDTPGDEDDTPRERADLTVTLPSQTRGSCPGGQGTCVHFVEVQVSNNGLADVVGAFDVFLETHNGLNTTVSVPGLMAGGSTSFIANLGPGNSCYNPNCTVSAVVDSGAVVPESDETNNSAKREDQG